MSKTYRIVQFDKWFRAQGKGTVIGSGKVSWWDIDKNGYLLNFNLCGHCIVSSLDEAQNRITLNLSRHGGEDLWTEVKNGE